MQHNIAWQGKCNRSNKAFNTTDHNGLVNHLHISPQSYVSAPSPPPPDQYTQILIKEWRGKELWTSHMMTSLHLLLHHGWGGGGGYIMVSIATLACHLALQRERVAGHGGYFHLSELWRIVYRPHQLQQHC